MNKLPSVTLRPACVSISKHIAKLSKKYGLKAAYIALAHQFMLMDPIVQGSMKKKEWNEVVEVLNAVRDNMVAARKNLESDKKKLEAEAKSADDDSH